MRKLRILALVHEYLVPPETPGVIDPATAEWETEYDVITTLRGIGHEVRALGVGSDLKAIRQVVEEWSPHIAFNLLEAFDGVAVYDHNVVSYLELLGVPYTGCNPRGLMLARDKGLSKKILAYHRIPAPEFIVVPVGRSIRTRKGPPFPVIVKSVTEDASMGISQASIVQNVEALRERVTFIHERVGTGAIVERYIGGRELYVGVIGNRRLQVFPVWELFLAELPEECRIATSRVKWNVRYQEKYGITSGEGKDLPPEVARRIRTIAKRVYRCLELSGYARMDLRLDPSGNPYVIEANPNAALARAEDLARSAEQAGMLYDALLQRIVNLGLRWRPDRPG